MRIAARYLILAAGFVSLSAFAACEQPAMVQAIPDGSTATMEQMITAQTAVKTYMTEMETYLACLNEDIEASGDDATAEFKTLMVTRYNTAVEELETVAAAFNQQLQAFRATNPADN